MSCVSTHTCHLSSHDPSLWRVWLHLLDGFPVGFGGLLPGAPWPVPSPGGASPGPCRAGQCCSPGHLGALVGTCSTLWMGFLCRGCRARPDDTAAVSRALSRGGLSPPWTDWPRSCSYSPGHGGPSLPPGPPLALPSPAARRGPGPSPQGRAAPWPRWLQGSSNISSWLVCPTCRSLSPKDPQFYQDKQYRLFNFLSRSGASKTKSSCKVFWSYRRKASLNNFYHVVVFSVWIWSEILLQWKSFSVTVVHLHPVVYLLIPFIPPY